MQSDQKSGPAAKLSKKFDIQKYFLFRHMGWYVSVRPMQHTPGSLILSLVRDCLSLGSLRQEEMIGFGESVYRIEQLLKIAFNPEKFNYLALMMIDPQVHFHVIPRFADQVHIDGQVWVDRDWPGPANLARLHEQFVDPKEIQDLLLAYMQKD